MPSFFIPSVSSCVKMEVSLILGGCYAEYRNTESERNTKWIHDLSGYYSTFLYIIFSGYLIEPIHLVVDDPFTVPLLFYRDTIVLSPHIIHPFHVLHHWWETDFQYVFYEMAYLQKKHLSI